MPEPDVASRGAASHQRVDCPPVKSTSTGRNAMRAAVVGMVLLCLVSGCTKPPQDVTNSIGMELIEIPAGKFNIGRAKTVS